jgi:hypothetical protein
MTNESRWEPGGARRKSIAALQEQQAAIDAVASSAHPVAAAVASATVAVTACEGGATTTADSQWLRQLDPATGKYYFTHHETGESRWEEAEEAREEEQNGVLGTTDAATNDTAADGGGQVPEWERLVDSASGHHYVVNRRTSESKWVVLESNSVALDDAVGGGEATTLERAEAAKQADVAAQAADEWVRALDPASGHFYRINRRTSESRWDAVGAAAPEARRVPEGPDTALGLAEPTDVDAVWVRKQDPSSGHFYRVNAHTRESRWEVPTESEDGDDEDKSSDDYDASVLAASNSAGEAEQLKAKVLAATDEAKADEQQQQQQQQQQQEEGEEEEEEEEEEAEGQVALTNSFRSNGAALGDFIASQTPDMGGAPNLMLSPGTPRALEPGFEFEAYIGGLGSGSTPRASPKQAGAGNGDSGAARDTPPPPPPPPPLPLPLPLPAEEAEQQIMKLRAARNRRASRNDEQ